MTQIQFNQLQASILSLENHADFHLVYALASIAVGLASALSLTASAALQDLAARANAFV